ncbi:MAG: hypothetical protein A2W01_02125 [Candidatus Solincola sediminis]|uniref:Lipid A biosynthesis acyltransferase n=1 Tax=Candidatus Solincola sediminis TaxID=1797199 RepID=A0A1F2WJ35_9ACTN|nr:MAG: hypothetical protein A2Y75_06680 [Candidatus Solincola sediminis]OFW57575.1 MAG: hypothetical protein A2W01_02125 [Candidatus Solincola sediminis]
MADEKRAPLILRVIDSSLLGIFNFVRFLARFVPPAILVGIANGIGIFLYYIRPGAREYLLATLRESLPEINDENELKRMAKKIFAGPIVMMLDVIMLERHGEEMDRHITTTHDVPAIQATIDGLLAKGKGLIMFSPHIGGIAIVHCMAARFDRAYTPVVLHPSFTPVPRYLGELMGTAEHLGSDPENPVFWVGMDVIPKVQEHLRQGKAIGITYDLQGGTAVDFFGHPTAIASGIAHFACDSGAPILPGYLLRGKNPLHFSLTLFDPLEYELTGDREADVKRILEMVIKEGERLIRSAPDQWLGWLGMRGWRRKAEKMMKSEA